MNHGFLRKLAVLLAFLAALAGCGGGGSGSTTATEPAATGGTGSTGGTTTGGGTSTSGGGQTSAVTFVPSSLAVVQRQGFSEVLGATVSILPLPQPPTPTSTLFVFIIAAEPVFDTTQVSLFKVGPASATGSIAIRRDLLPGTYTGTLTMKACWDSACSDPLALTGNQVAYSITVVPSVRLTATGPLTVVSFDESVGLPGVFAISSGATVVITSNIPVTWSKGSGQTGNDFTVISSTPTRLDVSFTGFRGGFVGVSAQAIQAAATTPNGAQLIFDLQ